MIFYFGYGSNINMVSLKAKGVVPKKSILATLIGWKLVFNVKHWFRHEGGVGNILKTDNAEDVVQGIVHYCNDDDLQSLDQMESYGVGYDRVEVELNTDEGIVKAYAYTGLPAFIDNNCLPSRRYLNIIVKGAEEADLESWYIDKLKNHPTCNHPKHPPFQAPQGVKQIFNKTELAKHQLLTGLYGHVFDMKDAREDLHCLYDLFGASDMTLFHLKRLDTSNGKESYDDIRNHRLSDYARDYLNNYLYEYMKEFNYVGSINYDQF